VKYSPQFAGSLAPPLVLPLPAKSSVTHGFSHSPFSQASRYWFSIYVTSPSMRLRMPLSMSTVGRSYRLMLNCWSCTACPISWTSIFSSINSESRSSETTVIVSVLKLYDPPTVAARFCSRTSVDSTSEPMISIVSNFALSACRSAALTFANVPFCSSANSSRLLTSTGGTPSSAVRQRIASNRAAVLALSRVSSSSERPPSTSMSRGSLYQ